MKWVRGCAVPSTEERNIAEEAVVGSFPGNENRQEEKAKGKL